MHRLVTLALAGVALTAAPAIGAQEGVPVEQAPYHVPVFDNDYVRVLNVVIPPGRTSGFHRHTLDTLGVQITDTTRTAQLPGGPVTVSPSREPGTVQFSLYGRTPNLHAVSVTGDGVFHNIVIELLEANNYGFTPGSRDGVPRYDLVLDNERVRAWRLVLAPGEQAPPITQGAPGLRIVVRGGELVERVRGRPDRGMAPRAGEFYWQDGGLTRAVENVGTTSIELVEVELK